MDAGSKWGTFVKIDYHVELSCGDWIRVGGVEFIVRFCGGGCAKSKRHAHYKLHSLRIAHEHQGCIEDPCSLEKAERLRSGAAWPTERKFKPTKSWPSALCSAASQSPTPGSKLHQFR